MSTIRHSPSLYSLTWVLDTLEIVWVFCDFLCDTYLSILLSIICLMISKRLNAGCGRELNFSPRPKEIFERGFLLTFHKAGCLLFLLHCSQKEFENHNDSSAPYLGTWHEHVSIFCKSTRRWLQIKDKIPMKAFLQSRHLDTFCLQGP